MPYRLDQPLGLAHSITRNKQVWLEQIQPKTGGYISTEIYRQFPLIKLLTLLPKSNP